MRTRPDLATRSGWELIAAVQRKPSTNRTRKKLSYWNRLILDQAYRVPLGQQHRRENGLGNRLGCNSAIGRSTRRSPKCCSHCAFCSTNFSREALPAVEVAGQRQPMKNVSWAPARKAGFED